MASAIGLGGSASATTSEATVYSSIVDGSGCVLYVLRNNDAANSLLVRYPKLNGATHYVPVPPGGTHYIVDKYGITDIFAKSSAGTCAYSGGPVGCMG